MKILLLAMVYLGPAFVFANILTTEQKDLILKIHNDYRRSEPSSNMRELVWSSKAEKDADNWAKLCKFEHENKGWGENIAFDAMPQNKNLEDKIKSMHKGWHDEKNQYTYGQKSCANTGACHYTQLVWAKTTEVGCSVIKCNPYYTSGSVVRMDELYHLVCFYKPRANFEAIPPFEQGAHCSKCPSQTSCKDQLCSAGEIPGTGNVEKPSKPDQEKPSKPDMEGNGKTDQGETPESGKGEEPDQGSSGNQGTQPGGLGDKLDQREISELLNLHNEIRKNKNNPALPWDKAVESFSKYIIRCHIQYPGMATDYANYAKYKSGSLSDVVKSWGNEDPNSDLAGHGCISLGNSPKCNHLTNMISKANKMGCAAKDCGSAGRQLTCLYRT